MKKETNSVNSLNKLDKLDKRTCETVMQDLSSCIDIWDQQNLDTTAAVLTVLKFTIDMTFRFTDNTYEAMELISTVINEKFDIHSMEDIEMIIRLHESTEKKVIH